MTLTPEQRTIRARLGGLALHASRDSAGIAQNARVGFLARFEREADPEGALSTTERQRRALILRRAYFQRLALASSRARSRAA